MGIMKARLDADRMAKPLTRIIHHPPEGQGAGHPLADPELEDVATGKRTPMTDPATVAGYWRDRAHAAEARADMLQASLVRQSAELQREQDRTHAAKAEAKAYAQDWVDDAMAAQRERVRVAEAEVRELREQVEEQGASINAEAAATRAQSRRAEAAEAQCMRAVDRMRRRLDEARGRKT